MIPKHMIVKYGGIKMEERKNNVLAFDLATTGLNLLQDRIVAIYCKIDSE